MGREEGVGPDEHVRSESENKILLQQPPVVLKIVLDLLS